MQLGANSVLFGGYDMETAFKYLALSGYDGIELSAIDGMSEHLVLDRWQELAAEIKRLSADYGLALLAMEQPSQDLARMERAFQAAAEIGIPLVNCGPGGTTGDDASLQQSIDSLGTLADLAGTLRGQGVQSPALLVIGEAFGAESSADRQATVPPAMSMPAHRLIG